jgi:hypothetical protein
VTFRPVPRDIPHDALLDYCAAINADLRRQRLAETEGPPEPVIYFTPREERLAREHQQRQDRLNGVDHEAEREVRLIRHLQAVYGESPEAAAIGKRSPYAYERLYFPDYVNVG